MSGWDCLAVFGVSVMFGALVSFVITRVGRR